MKLRTSLLLAVVVPLAAGMLVCLFFAVIPMYRVTTEWNTKASEAVQGMRVSAATVRLTKMNDNLQVLYSQLEHDLGLLRNGTYDALANKTEVLTYPPTYYGAPLAGAPSLPAPQEDRLLFHATTTGAGFERFSAALQQGKMSMDDVMGSDYAEPTSLVDPLWKALYKTNRGGSMNRPAYYMKLMMGFEDSFYRRYPFPSATNGFPADYTDGTTLYCDPTIDVAFIGLTAYHPQCRPWYRQAKDGWSRTRAAGTTDEIAVFSTPYIDAASRTVTISASTPLSNRRLVGEPFMGVINIDFNMSSIDRVVQDPSISVNGYFFLMTTTGVIISHPRFVDRSVPVMVAALEPGLQSVWTSWLASPAAVSSATPTMELVSDVQTNEAVFVAASSNLNAGYILVVMIPARDFTDDDHTALRKLRLLLAGGTAAVVIIVALLLLVLFWITRQASDHYAATLNDATLILSQQQKPDLQAQLLVRAPVCYELDLLFSQFPPMLVATRFGNDKFYDGKWDLALRDYAVAETLMQRSKNRKGLGKVYNNQGNVYVHLGNHAQALIQYNKSIQIGMELLQDVMNQLQQIEEVNLRNLAGVTNVVNASTTTTVPVHDDDDGEERKEGAMSLEVVQVQPQHQLENVLVRQKRELQRERMQLLTTLAMRQENLGVLYKTQHQLVQAYASMQKALELHQSADNDLGMAQLSSNLAQFYLEDGRIPEAEKLITKTYARLSEVSEDHVPDPKSLQHATLTLGLLCQAQQRWSDAAGWYQFTLQLQEQHAITNAQVQQNCFDRLAYVFTVMNLPDMAHKYRRLQNRNQILKNVLFTLDTSGSMAGSRIEQCRSSISDIMRRYIDPEDRVGVVTFNRTSKTILPLTLRGWDQGTLQRMLATVRDQTNPNGQTAFWDALVMAIQQMQTVTAQDAAASSASAGAPAAAAVVLRNNWIISQTDGEDNVSANSAEAVCKWMKAFPVHIVIITVGSQYDKASVLRIIATAKAAHKQGHHLAIETDSIEAAFQNVAKLITHQLHVETL